MRDGPAAQAPHQALVLHHERLPGWPVAGPLRQKRTTAVERSQLGQHPVTSQNDPLLLLLLLFFLFGTSFCQRNTDAERKIRAGFR